MSESTTGIVIVPTAERFVEGFAAAVDRVARERRYLGFVEGPSVERMRSLIRRVVAGEGTQRLAVTPADDVVGWCDVLRHAQEGFRHVGSLGMGLLPAYRGRGLGKALAQETVRAARVAGIERIELEVFATNHVAISLYTAMGFRTEGVKQRARKIDRRYDDLVCMALLD